MYKPNGIIASTKSNSDDKTEYYKQLEEDDLRL